MRSNARRLLVFVLFALSLLPLGVLIPPYIKIYSILEQYHVEGLVLCWLIAYGLANLCAPGFMQGGISKTEYENSGPREIIRLYLSVMMITFVALVVVFFGLWCVGWFLYFVEVVFAWFFYLIFGNLLLIA